MLNRIMGVLTLKAPVYREIAEDTSATGQAGIIVAIVAVINGILGGAAASIANSTLAQLGAQQGIALPTISPLGAGLNGFISAFVGWLVGSWVLAFAAKQFFQGKTNTQEMLRVTGYTSVFTILGAVLSLIPCLGAIAAIAAAVLQLIGNVIGIREAPEVDTTRSILIAIIAAVILVIIGLVISSVLGLIFR
jgi:hypothetical protein